MCLGFISVVVKTDKGWQKKDIGSSLLRELQNYNLLLSNCQQKNIGSHQKDTLCPRAKRSPSKIVGVVKSCLESNPTPRQRYSRRLKQTLFEQDQDPDTRIQTPPQRQAELSSDVSCRGTGQQWPAAGARALDAADLGMAPSPLGGGHH